MKRIEKRKKTKLLKATMFSMAIFVALLFFGSAVAASLAGSTATFENNIEKQMGDPVLSTGVENPSLITDSAEIKYSDYLGSKVSQGSRAPGDTCDNPLFIDIPADLNYSDIGQTTCGRGNNYQDTATSYNNGEDIFYQLNVTTDITVEIIMDPVQTWSGLFLYSDCPENLPPGGWLAAVTRSDATPRVIVYHLTVADSPYYIMVDTWPSPPCVDFDLFITEYVYTDVGVNAILSPVDGVAYGTIPVSVEVENFGTTDAMDVPVTVTIDEIAYGADLFFEDFQDYEPAIPIWPPGWTIEDNASQSWYLWPTNTRARCDRVLNEASNEWLISPAFDFSAESEVVLNFLLYYFHSGAGIQFNVYGSTDGGDTWDETIAQYTASVFTQPQSFDISSWAAGESDVKIAFNFVTAAAASTSGYVWIDDVKLSTPDMYSSFFNEDFSDNVLPSGWQNFELGDPGFSWTFYNRLGYDIASIDSDGAGSGNYVAARLETAAIDCSGKSGVALALAQHYTHSAATTAKIEISTDGANWIEVIQFSATVGGATYPTFIYDISSWADGESTVYLAFDYDDGNTWAWYWRIDELSLIDGITPEVVHYETTFNDVIPAVWPSGWTTTVYSAAKDWIGSESATHRPTGSTGIFAHIIAQSAAPVGADAGLMSAPFDASGLSGVTVEFLERGSISSAAGASGTLQQVKVYSDSVYEETIFTRAWTGSFQTPNQQTTVTFNPSGYTDPSSVQIEFYFTTGGFGTGWWSIDNVNVFQAPSLTNLYNETVNIDLLSYDTMVVDTFPDWTVSNVGFFRVEACIDLVGDENPDNDCLVIPELEIVEPIHDVGVASIVQPSAQTRDEDYWYAFGAFSSAFFGPGRFVALDASTFENIAPLTADSHPFAGDWYDGGWLVLSNLDKKLYDVCVETGDQTYRATTTLPTAPSGLTVHQGILYASTVSALYEVDPDTGNTVYIGDFVNGGSMISIGSDDDKIYGISITDNSAYTINPDTGYATLLGPTGYSINFAQDMAVDRNTGDIYHAAYMGAGSCHLTKLNKATGVLDYISTFPSVEIIAFAIPYDGVLPNQDHPVEAMVKNYGDFTETGFDVEATITDTDTDIVVYTDIQTVTAVLEPGDEISVDFAIWTPPEDGGNFRIEICTNLSTDQNPDNDCRSKLVSVLPDIWVDVGVTEILSPKDGDKQGVIPVEVKVENFGDTDETFDVNFKISEKTGGQQYVIDQWVNPSSFPATTVTYTLTDAGHGVGSEFFQLAFIFDGYSWNTNNWNIDDIVLTAGNVTLFEEDFTGVAVGAIPTGWTKSPNTANWGAVNTALAGGVAPEMRFYFSPSATDRFYLKTSAIDTSGYDELTLEFKHYLSHYSGPYTLEVIATTPIMYEVVYDETVTVSVDAGDTLVVDTFPVWTGMDAGFYNVEACTLLDDYNPGNDCKSLVDIEIIPLIHDVGVESILSPFGGSSLHATNEVIFHQEAVDPSGSWAFINCDSTLGYGGIENFDITANVPIGKVSVVGLPLYHDGVGWVAFPPEDVVLDVVFFDDAYGSYPTIPSDVIATFTGIDTFESIEFVGTYAGFSAYEWTFELPDNVVVSDQEGWMQIEAPSGFMWGNSKDGDLISYQIGVGWITTDDRAMTLYSGEDPDEWPNQPYPVEAIVMNYGDFTETFDVEATIIDTDTNEVVYTDVQTVTDLEPGDSIQVDFAIWTPPAAGGNFKVTICTLLVGDDNPANDCKSVSGYVIWDDTTPPETTHEFSGILGDNGWYISDVLIELTATDDISGVNYTMYSINDADFELYVDPITYTEDGIHNIRYYSVDFAGNEEDVKGPFEFKIDQTPPTIELTVEKQLLNRWLLTAEVSDETSGIAKVEFYVNDELLGEVTEEPFELLYIGAKKGDVAQAVVYDNAGNSQMSDLVEPTALQSQQTTPALQVQQTKTQKNIV